MKSIRLKDLKKGEFFTRKPISYPKENQVFIRDDYDRINRKYIAIRFSDISDSTLINGDTLVYIDFIF